jgi:hypothetical protein
MIRIREGMVFLNKETITFDKTTTTITDKDITTAGFNCVVTANAEQIPKTCTAIGFSLLKGFFISFNIFAILLCF